MELTYFGWGRERKGREAKGREITE